MIVTKIARAAPQGPLRTAAYCRVSTRRESQEESFEAQKKWYAARIRAEPGWVLAGIYSDRRSGASAANRPGFQSMMTAAQAGQLDLILVKSISRFARNLLECQQQLERLQHLGVVVIFEKENLRTDEPSGAFLLKLLAAVAQSESRSISQNVRLSCRSRSARGQCRMGNNRILGYDDVDGRLVPNQDAWIVQTVYSLFLQGNSYGQIAQAIASMGGRTLRGKSCLSPGTIRYMLTNEAYRGDRKLLKTPPRRDLSRQPIPAPPVYYLANDHLPLIDPPSWQRVQEILEKRKKK